MESPKSLPKPSDASPFGSLRVGGSSCPSDLALDRLHAGELQGEAKTHIESHLKDCPVCPQRMAERQAGFDAFPQLDSRPVLAAVHRKLAEPSPSVVSRFSLRRLFAVLIPAAAVGVVTMIMLVGGKPTSQLPQMDGVREKGSSALHVFRQSGERSTEMLSGDSFSPGDRVRFIVDLPRRGHIAVLGIESAGTLYVAWPQDDKSVTLFDAGKGQQLEGAVALDEKPGRETLYLVNCPESVGSPVRVCQSAGSASPPTCPSGCSLGPFVLQKK